MSKEKLIDLDREQLDLLHAILKQHIPNKTVWAYGSRATWKAKETSDLDLAVFDCTPMEIYHLKEELEESDLLISVDVMDWETIPESFKENIREKYVVVQEEKRFPEGWRKTTIGEITRLNVNSVDKNYNFELIQYLDTGSITNGQIETLQTYQLSNAPSRARRLVKDQDIVYSTVRPIQRHYGYLKKPPANLVVSTAFSVIETIKSSAEPLFVYYLLTTENNVEILDAIAEGSTSAYPSLRPADIEKLEIYLPPLPEQKAIAKVLSSLDDKIDLLHRQNKTLEAMAQALFRKWFVVDKDEGWGVISLYDAIELVGGGTPSTSVSEYWGGEIGWVSGRDVAANHKGIISSAEKSISAAGLKSSPAKLIPKHSTVISARGTCGKYCILSKPMAFSQSNYGIKPKFGASCFFTYLLIDYSIDGLQSAAYGSVFDTITTDTFKGHSVKLPQAKVIRKFEIEVTPLFEKMISNQSQIQILENLRTALLPKLMSGEVKLIPAEKNLQGIETTT